MSQKINPYLLRGVLVGALGGLLFGFDTAVIAGTTHDLRILFQLSPVQLGITVSSALWGTVVGAMFSGVLGERFGGRESLRILAGCYIISALGCALSPTWPCLLLFRFVGGLGIGGSSVLGPVYMAEIAPAKWRGRMVGCFQINIVIGVLAAYFSNYTMGRLNLGTHEWRWQLGIAAIPALLFLVMLFHIPRSARWLVTKGRLAEAEEVLRTFGSESPSAELAEIVESVHPGRVIETEHLFQRKYRFPIYLAISAAMFNQLTGINAITYYLNDIFAMGGYSKMSSALQAVAIGVMNLLATLLGMTVIDRLGRKTLLLIGSVGITIALSGVSAVFFTHSHQSWLLYLLVGYIAFFAVSQGAVIWVFLSEVFPNRVRAKGQSLGSSTHWIMNALISGLFPLFAARSGGYPFAFFALIGGVLQFFVVMFTYPETKGISLEEMQRKFGID